MPSLDIGQGHYISDSVPLVNMKCINWYPQYPVTKGALSPAALFRTPGISEVNSTGNDASRGLHKFQKSNWWFGVNGTSLFVKKTEVATPINLGTILGSPDVIMSDNGETLCIIVPGLYGYFLDIDTLVLTQITAPDFLTFMAQDGGVTSVTELNNRFVYTTNQEFFIGSLVTTNKGTDFDELDSDDAESANDPIVRSLEANGELYVFNTETIELYKDIGGTDFPLVRIPGGTVEIGLKGKYAVSKVDKTFYLIGGSINAIAGVHTVTNSQSRKISTPSIDLILAGYSDTELSAVNSWTYSIDGNIFVGFRLPNETVVYDAAASALAGVPIWHLRQSGDTTWRVKNCITIFNKVYVDDAIDGRWGELNREVATEYDSTVLRTLGTLYVATDIVPFKVKALEVTATRGVGTRLANPTPAGSNPTLNLSFTIDQGNTYAALEPVELGNVGTYGLRQQWRRLGRVDSAIAFEITMESPVLADIQKLSIEVV